MNPYPTHVGSLVRAELSRQNQTVTWLAQQLGIQRTNCYRILSAQSVHTALLERISVAMKHDFFAEYSKSVKL
jgi:plasmid maintenance system antidote protein VapI